VTSGRVLDDPRRLRHRRVHQVQQRGLVIDIDDEEI